MPEEPVPARLAPRDALEEMVGAVRRALTERGEFLAPEWFDRAVSDLKSGALAGWYLPAEAGPAGLAFLSARPPRGFGHVHVEPGASEVPRALNLTEAMVGGIDPAVRRIDFGLTGLSRKGVEEFESSLVTRSGFTLLHRYKMGRRLSLDEAPETAPPPAGLSLVPADTVPLERLQAADWQAFRGSPDEQLIAETPEANRRVLAGILGGSLGLFLPEASPALLDAEGLPAGFLLSTEESPRCAGFVDLVVLPAFRRRGLGRWLFGRGLRALVALGYSEVSLWVTETNTPALALYERFGLERRAVLSIYRWARPGAASEAPQPHSSR